MKKHLTLLLSLLSCSSQAFAERPPSHDLLYTMSAGKHPWGYIHEVIEPKESGLNCRIEIVREEGNGLYTEHLSAMAEKDDAITPKYFNLRKYSMASGAAEIVDGNNDPEKGMYVKISGQRNFKQPPIKLPKNAILECYLPTWFQKHFKELTPGAKKTVTVFAESSSLKSFRTESAYISVPLQQKRPCKTVHMEFQGVESDWCVRADGVYEEILIGREKTLVKLAPSEKAAKDFLPKTGK